MKLCLCVLTRALVFSTKLAYADVEHDRIETPADIQSRAPAPGVGQKLPERTLTQQECEKEGGRLTSVPLPILGLISAKQLCENGTPVGIVSNVRCHCVCCK